MHLGWRFVLHKLFWAYIDLKLQPSGKHCPWVYSDFLLSDKVIQSHHGNKPPALYDIPCWGSPDNPQRDSVEGVDSPTSAPSDKSRSSSIVSTPRLLQVTVGSPVSTRASSQEHVYDYPLVSVSLLLPSKADGESSSHSSDESASGHRETREQVKVLQVFKLCKYTIPSFPVISVKLRHAEVRRPNLSGVGSIVLDAYLKERSSVSTQSLPRKILVYESCIVSVSVTVCQAQCLAHG